jgi:hypothetical protein
VAGLGLVALIKLWMWIEWLRLPEPVKASIRVEEGQRRAEAQQRQAALETQRQQSHQAYLARKAALEAERNRPAFTTCPRCDSPWINQPASFGQNFKRGLMLGLVAELTHTGVIVDNRDAGVWTCDNCRYRWIEK